MPEDALIIVPVRNVVLFPGMVVPLGIGRERSVAAVQEAVRLQRPLGVLLQNKPEVEEPGPSDAALGRHDRQRAPLHHRAGRLASRRSASGVQRFRVLQFLDGYPFTVARVQLIEDPAHIDADIEGRAHSLKERATEILKLLPQVPAEMVASLQGVEGPGALADLIAGLMDISAEEKQALLETFDLKARLDKLLDLLTHRIEVLKVSREIDERTRESIGDANRKHVLREQMRTIQKELGEGDEGAAEIAELERAIAEAKMPEEVEKQARKELKRLERMPEGARRVLDDPHLPRLADRTAVGGRRRRIRSTSPRRARSSTKITTGSRRSSGAFSSTSRCASSIRRARARSSASSGRPAWARPRSARASPRRPGASSCA